MLSRGDLLMIKQMVFTARTLLTLRTTSDVPSAQFDDISLKDLLSCASVSQ